MAYFKHEEKLSTKEEALDYMELHGIMTDATFPDLNDDSFTKQRMQPIYDYLKENGMEIISSGFYDSTFEFGAVYYMFDVSRFDSDTSKKEVNEILKLWSKSN
ncbi:hypothetical protein [Pediococcus pentosaceus]|uniref:hypothetical protein n=1 Tax=Pediococcus pentosaceus TaxID=1255 RepID=UPI00132FAA6F|nr:hypothetical protein [Pediococcus pentosaceus]KAF0468579.1 hypothetical protein GBP05_00915 [Pediococcus pentosaceus]MCM6792880.1 hypothetical protein [Pediococcus pentosaceus]